MSGLTLTDFSISNRYSDDGLHLMQSYLNSDDPAKTNRFLASGGSTWFAENNVGYDQERQRQWLDKQREIERLDREWALAHWGD